MITLKQFVSESNRIEGIHQIREGEVEAHSRILNLDQLSVAEVEDFVWAVAQREMRDKHGRNVRIGNHIPPAGGPNIRRSLEILIDSINELRLSPFLAHVEYETLHPFLDGNGRSGRVIWLWMMEKRDKSGLALPFLHRFYYQSFDSARKYYQ